MPLKVVVSSAPLSTGSQARGVGVYTRSLVSALRSEFDQDQYYLESEKLYGGKYDLVHFPFFNPFFLTLPWRMPLPTVVTIHDLIEVKYPAHFPRGLRGELKWQLQKRLVQKVQAIVTDSEASKLDIAKYLAYDHAKIHVIPLAPVETRVTKTIADKIRTEYQLPSRFVLYVGDINWNKNVVGLVEAFGKLNTSAKLVLVSKALSGAGEIPERKRVLAAINSSPRKKDIQILDFVPSHHLAMLYRLATLYVQPSFDEGFGLPILEAMQQSCPVASSNQGSLPEVGGEAVAYFDPTVKGQMAKVLDELLTKAPARNKLAKLGDAWVDRFSWEQTARLTHQVYQRVLA